MDPNVKQDILRILLGVEDSFKRYNADEIMEWSNHIIHSASIKQEKYTSQVAIVIYSIGKIMARGKIRRYPQEAWNAFETTVRNELVYAVRYLKKGDLKLFSKSILNLQKAVVMLDKSFMQYADYVVDTAKLKKGAKIHEHGISMKRVAELFGVTEWELRNFAGTTKILERDLQKGEVADRLKKIRGLFK